MNVSNLSQLKGAMRAGHTFEVLEHPVHPEYVGQTRCVQVLQTNGMYTGISGDPGAPISKVNHGKGSWIAFGKASDWRFSEGGVCKQYAHEKHIWTIRVND